MADEKTFTIPLRKEFSKVPNYKRTKKAIIAVKEYLVKHMKSDDVKLGPHLNELIWAKGRKNPPSKVKVKAIKDDKNVVMAELPEFEFKIKKEEKTKKKEKKEAKEELLEQKTDLSLQKNIKKAAKEQSKKQADSEEKTN